MARKSPVRGLHPAYRVYLLSFVMFVGAVASFLARVKVLGFVFVAFMFVFAGITTVMLLALARRAKADLRATPRAVDTAPDNPSPVEPTQRQSLPTPGRRAPLASV